MSGRRTNKLFEKRGKHMAKNTTAGGLMNLKQQLSSKAFKTFTCSLVRRTFKELLLLEC